LKKLKNISANFVTVRKSVCKEECGVLALRAPQTETDPITDFKPFPCMAKDWLRTDRLARIAQNKRFCEGVLRFETKLGLNRAEVADVIRDLHWSSYYLQYEVWVEKELETAEIRAKAKHDGGFPASLPPANLLPTPPSGVFEGDATLPLTPEPGSGIDARFRALVRAIKASHNYDAATGGELDVLAPPSTPNSVTTQPKLKVQALTGGAIQLTVRPMKFGSVSFQCRVAGSVSFLTIAKSTTGKLTWNAPPPFPRELEVRARFEDGDQPVGVPCPVLPVTALA
jgi:hypothetical protein